MIEEQQINRFQPLVLMIDDSSVIRMQAGGFLKQSGFRVIEAEDGSQALGILEKITPDLILLDIEMPGINGFELCSLLRKYSATAHIPVLILTGIEDNAVISQAHVAGATDFAFKPVNWELLGQRLRYLYRGSKIASRLQQERSKLDAAQRMAKLGSWQQDLITGEEEWSDYMYQIVGLSPEKIKPNFINLLNRVPMQQREQVSDWYEGSKSGLLRRSIEHRVVLDDGQTRAVRHQIEPEISTSGDVVRLLAIVQDITESKLAQRKVRQLECFDSVTNLPNRNTFQQNLEKEIQEARSSGWQLAILHLNLNDFKRINDAFGHEVGDKLLYGVGNRLQDVLGTLTSKTQLSKIIGDEFTILISSESGPVDIRTVSNLISKALNEPFTIDDKKLYTTATIGVSLYPEDGDSVAVLMKKSAIAMSEARNDSVTKIQTYSIEMEERAFRRYEIDAQLHNAVSANELSLHYQPLVDLNTGRTYCAEALLRWENSVLGKVSPQEFVSVAEANGLIVLIGEWVLKTACENLLEWRRTGFDIPKVAVNVSTMQFEKSDVPGIVKSILAELKLPAHCLELEITESMLLSTTHAIKQLNTLNQMGVTLTVDDFGTGYSSLGQLKNFPIHRLKIDRSFIKNLTSDRDDVAITRSIITMAQSMSISVLAEGVEDEEQLHMLRNYNCDEIQGYLVSKPLPQTELIENMPEITEKLSRLLPSFVSRIPKAV